MGLQVYQYFTIYRQYFFLKFQEVPSWVKVPGTAPYWKARDSE